MATTLPAGAVAVNIVGNDSQFQQTITQINTSIQKFQKNVTNINGAMKTPGFQGWKAGFRDTMVTLAAMEHVFSRVFSRISSAFKTAITDMATFGDTYAKMARRTGMGAKDLSLLGYAAEQSEASVADMGNSLKFLNRNLALAERGSKAAKDAFSQIGIDSSQLQFLDKKEQFLVVADAIRRLGDEAKQTDAAMKIFGRGGTSMLPMLQEGAAGIRALMQEADDQGIGISDEDAAKAEVLMGAIIRMKRSMEGFRRTIMSSLVEPVSKFLEWGAKIIKNLREWINANQSVTMAVFKLAGVVAITGVAFATWRFVGPMIKRLFNPIGTLTAFLWKLSVAVWASLGPYGLLIAAITGVASAILYFTGAGSKLMSWFSDIAAMIKDGRIVDAVKVMWLEIQLLFEEGKLAIMNKWNEVAAAISEPFMAIYESVSSAVKPAVEWLIDTFNGIGGWISDQFTEPMQSLMDWFGWLWTSIKGGWEALMNDTGAVIVGTWWGIASGINSAWSWLRTQWNNLLTAIQVGMLTAMKVVIQVVSFAFDKLFSIVQAFAGVLGMTVTNPVQAAIDGIDNMIDGVRERAGVKAEEIADNRAARQAALDAAAVKSLDNVDKAKANAPQTNSRIEGLKREIAELKKPINKPGEKSRQITETAQRISQQGASSIVQGTINKADILGGALAYMASEKDHSEDIADNTGKMVDLLEGISRKEGGMMYG